MRKKLAATVCVIALALGLSACGGQGAAGGEAFTVRVVCRSADIYQIFYTCYIGGERRGMGGLAGGARGGVSPPRMRSNALQSLACARRAARAAGTFTLRSSGKVTALSGCRKSLP